ncbi:MAG: helix-turn-helix domain-containing protein [bacterium]
MAERLPLISDTLFLYFFFGKKEEEVFASVAIQVAKLREEEGLTRQELGKLSHPSRQTIYKLECPGNGSYSLKTLLKIAHALNKELKVEFIVKEEDKIMLNYRNRLLKEVQEMPDEVLPWFYKIVYLLNREFTPSSSLRKKEKRGSLKGIWKGARVDEDLLLQAKKSLFPYEYKEK